MKLIAYLIAFLMLVPGVFALSAQIEADKSLYYYPADSEAMLSISLEDDDVFGEIVDLKYTIDITGPAALRGVKTETISSLEKKYAREAILELNDPASERQEPIIIKMNVEYVLNSKLPGGGKKTQSTSKTIFILSTEGTKVAAQKLEVENQLLECNNSLTSCTSQMQKLESSNTALSAEIATLQTEKNALDATLKQSYYPPGKWELIGLKGYLVILLFIILPIASFVAGWKIMKK